MILKHLHHLFSTNKNYTNQFKVRSRLAQFFKHIHPDQMAQAPPKIKQENLRSLKNFNAYFDAINQQKPIEAKLLKFYISQKTNNKSRKFFSFNLELPELNAQQVVLTDSKAQKLIDDIVTALNNKFKQSRNLLEGKKKQKITVQPQINYETEQQRLSRMQQTVGPFQNFKKYIHEQQLKNAINAKFMQGEKQALKLKLRQNMSFANTATNKPMMWSRIIMDESGIYNDYQNILKHLIDPKLIYFSENIGIAEIEQFKKKLLPGELDRLGVRATQAVLRVCEEMQACTPPLCLYVTTHYSATEIPGFFSIPYDFNPVQFLDHFTTLKEAILQQRTKYEQLYDFFQDLSRDLRVKNKFKVKPPTFKNNPDISQKMLVLQRLAKYTVPEEIDVNILEQEELKIFCKQYNRSPNQSVHIYRSKLFLSVSFIEKDLQQAVHTLNQPKEVQPPLNAANYA